MSNRQVIVHPDANTLAHAAAARLITKLLDLQSQKRPLNLALTGGSIGIAMLAAAAENPAIEAVDWDGVHLWWGDERFLPEGDADRNDTQALRALPEALPKAHLHPVPVTRTPEEAAELYSAALPERMDVTLLGVGPDGHVASLFPNHPGLAAPGKAVAVRDSPKPPSERVSFTLEMINGSDEVWLIAAGAEKAAALRDSTLPVAQVRGQKATLLLTDVAAVAVSGESDKSTQ